MAIGIVEYAAAAGITPRAARMRAERGVIDASRIGRTWVVPDHELARAIMHKAIPPGRPASAASFERVAAYLDGDHEGLSAEHRRQASKLASRLRVEDPAPALRFLARRRAGEPHAYHASSEDLEALSQVRHLMPGGISDPWQTRLSSHGLFEAYVHAEHLPGLEARFGLSPVVGPLWNVMLRAVDTLPPRRHLRLAADLLDAGDARSVTEACRIVRTLTEPPT